MEISPPGDVGIIRLSGRTIAAFKIFSILVFVYSLLIYARAVYAQKDFSSVYKKVAPSVVEIDVLDREGKLKRGTGFFIREDGLLVTSYHVTEGSVKTEVKLSNGEIMPSERIVAEDREGDLVLLKLLAKGRSFPTLKVSDTKIEAGQPVLVIGSPLGLEGTILDGIISEIREIPNVGKIIQITAPISPGSSGSPVLNTEGEAIGVATAYLREGQNLNFAIPVEKIDSLLYKKAANELSATDWFEKGLALMESGKYQDAIEAYSKAIELNPEYAWAYCNRGIAYRNLEDYRQAIRDYDKAIELDPKDADIYCNRGNAYGSLGDYRQAIRDYDKAIELNSKDADTYYNRGITYGSLGDYRQAIRDFDRAIELNPEDAKAYYYRGITYGSLGDYRQEIRDYDRAIELDPKDALAYYNRGLAYAKLEDYRQAIRDFDRAIELDPKDALAYFNRGSAHGKLGNFYRETMDSKIAAKLGYKPAQDFLRSKGIDW